MGKTSRSGRTVGRVGRAVLACAVLGDVLSLVSYISLCAERSSEAVLTARRARDVCENLSMILSVSWLDSCICAAIDSVSVKQEAKVCVCLWFFWITSI